MKSFHLKKSGKPMIAIDVGSNKITILFCSFPAKSQGKKW